MPRRPKDLSAMEAWSRPQSEPNPPCLTSPLSYMLDCLNDPDVPAARKDRLAIAAAPYCHPRVAEAGKKAQQAKMAAEAVDDAWGGDLQSQ